jgi:hypothetical protein
MKTACASKLLKTLLIAGAPAWALAFGSPAPSNPPSAPAPAPNKEATLVGIISDLNGTECQTVYPRNSIVAFENLLKQKPSHIIMPGDLVHGECLSYAGAKPYADVAREMWQSFETNFFSKIPNGTSLSVAPGNHDAPWLTTSSRQTFRIENEAFKDFWNKKEFALGVTRFRMAGVEDNYPYYWAYMTDDIFFVSLQSTRTSSLSDGVRQKAWLKAVLASPTARAARARIVYGHVPPYPVLDPSVGRKYEAVMGAEQVGNKEALVDLLLDQNVDLLVVAHSHAPYPGELLRKSDGKKIKILSMPCGHAARTLHSHEKASPRGYALLRIDADGTISISVKDWSQGAQVPYDFFPMKIDMRDAKIDYRRVPQGHYH